eukprot:GHVS01039877.1.p1 GENE.GHVS01039877.1~~GHVS01039877.1.p1  ORF type:complete len:320 (-),score=29.26 GHVS01039877.1:220-1179(-)
MAGVEGAPVGFVEADLWKKQFQHMLGGPYTKVRSDRRKVYYVGGISFFLVVSLIVVSIYYWAATIDDAATNSSRKDATASMLALLPLDDLLEFRTTRLPVSAEKTLDFDIFSITRIGEGSDHITVAELSDHHTLTIKDGGVCTLFSDSNAPLYQWTVSLHGDDLHLDHLPSLSLFTASPRHLGRKNSGSFSGRSSGISPRRKHQNDLRTYIDNLPQAIGASMYPYGINPFHAPGYDYGPMLGQNPGPPLGPHPFTADLLRAGWPGPPFNQFIASEGPPGRSNSPPDGVDLSGVTGGDGRAPARGWGPTNNFDIVTVRGS